VAGGFFLAARGHIDFVLLLATLVGVALVIASGCVLNNYIDRGIDSKMSRTKDRALVKGTIPAFNAITYAVLMGIAGFAVLWLFTNLLTVCVGLVGLVDYVVLYGISKRYSVYGTIVGSISGATPIVAGYTAVTNVFDTGAVLIFLIMVFWQMPHFYAIAIRRLEDYKSAGLPVLPIVSGLQLTKINIVLYIVAYLAGAAMLTVLGYAGYTYLAVMIGFSLTWLRLAVQGFTAKDDRKWAAKVFGFSLLVLLAFSIMISVSWFLP
jgi:protoheme IX farnesyltransferase